MYLVLEKLNAFNKISHKNLNIAKKLLTDCRPLLDHMKEKFEDDMDDTYINLSSSVISQVFSTIIEVENKDIKDINKAYKKFESETSQRNTYNAFIERQNRYRY